MLVRLQDIHTDRDFDLAFEARYFIEADGEVQITMHPSQLRSLAEDISAVLADLPAEQEDEVRVEPPAAPNPIHEIYRGLTRRLWDAP